MKKTIKNFVALLVCLGFIAVCIFGLGALGEPASAALWESAVGLWQRG